MSRCTRAGTHRPASDAALQHGRRSTGAAPATVCFGRGRSTGGWSAWRAGGRRRPHPERLAPRRPRLDRRRDAHPLPDARPRDARPRVLRRQPGRASSPAPAAGRRLAAHHLALLVAGRRVDPPRSPEVQRRRALRRRAPHRRLEQLHARAVGGDRARHRGLPREGQRLERHRLQLSRRQVRPGVRGPLRRHRQGRDRRARGGLQHRLGRRRGARELRHVEASRLRRRRRSSRCSPGGSISRTSIRSRR